MNPKFDINLFALKITSDKNIINKFSKVRISGNFKDRIDQIVSKVINL